MAKQREHTCLNNEVVTVEASELWWERDGYGIPLALVCDKCHDEKMSQFRSDIKGRYETDEEIGDTDGAWEDDCYGSDLDW